MFGNLDRENLALETLPVLCVACGSTSATSSSPSTLAISGTVTDRIAGGPIDGSTITLTGPTTKSAPVANGQYQLGSIQPGTYGVTIKGTSHVDHETQSVPINASGNFSFSVLKWGSCGQGACYDQTFDSYYNQIARSPSRQNSVQKWDLLSGRPTTIYVIDDGSITPDAMNSFLAVLNQVNNESVPGMYCNQIGQLQIKKGAAPVQEFVDGEIIVNFRTNQNSTGYNWKGNVIAGASINLSGLQYQTFIGNMFNKEALAHELFHAAFASHETVYRDSLMQLLPTVSTLSAQDQLASCIVYSKDTHPGNVQPDINPSY